MSLGDILTEQARTRPGAVAILDARAGARHRLTFAGLEEETGRAAGWLQGLGLRRGQTVLVFVPMSADLYVALLAMFRLGVVALFLDPSAGREHIARCCARRPPDALLAVRRAHWLRLLSPALRRIPLKIAVGGWTPWAHRWPERFESAPAAAATIAPDEAALITFTSGSTGGPKAAVRTHGFLLAQHRALAPAIALESGEIDLATLPVFTLANLASGVTTVIPDADLRRPGAVNAARLFAQMERTGVTRLTASPAFFEQLVAHGLATSTTLPSLRKLYTGGAPVFPRLLEAMRKLAPQAEVVAVYGSTEAEPIAHLATEEISADDMLAMRAGRGLLAGRPVPEVKLRIVRDRWGAPRKALTSTELGHETMPAGVAGEIVVTGNHVLKGYWGGVGDEESKFQVEGEVWHRTGDAGLLDDQGRLWLLGRCAARISDDRGELYPFTVECVAMTFAEVRRAAALAHTGRRLLVVESVTATSDLAVRLKAATAWAQMDEVRFLGAMPVDQRHNAKIDYPALRKMLGS
jgi:acyl-CoA synthetase (AMP-forming)/AMP-acid ligase II